MSHLHIHVYNWRPPLPKFARDAEWEPHKHPRGQPGNAGQFGPGGGGGGKSEAKTVKAEHIAKELGLDAKLFRAALRKLKIAKSGAGYAWTPEEAKEIKKKVAAFKKIVLSSDLPPKEAAAEAVAKLAEPEKKEEKPKEEKKEEAKAEPEKKEWKKIGGQLGSNEGGVFESPSGVKHYAKFYKDPGQGRSEVQTGRVYEKLGIRTNQPGIENIDGKEAVTTKWNEDLVPFKPVDATKLTDKQKEQAAKMFIGAVLTKNWDAVGPDYGNIMIDKKTGDLVNVDMGGAFNYRAQGKAKPYNGDNINEWDSFLSGMNPTTAKVFGPVINNMTPETAKKLLTSLDGVSGMKIANKDLQSAFDQRLELIKQKLKDTATADPHTAPARKKAINQEIADVEENSHKHRKEIAKAKPVPNPHQKSAMISYKGAGYQDMNAGLRNPPPPDFVKAKIDYLKGYLNKASIPEDTTLWRGIKSAYGEKLLNTVKGVGDTFNDDGFVSVSTSGEFAAGWAGWKSDYGKGVLLKVEVKKGAKGATVEPSDEHDGEREIVLQAGAKFRIKAIDKENRFIHVEHYEE